MQTRMTLSEAYRILGLSNEATLAEAKAAYRRAVADAHPDRGGTAAEFIRVRAAYEILSGFLAERGPADVASGGRASGGAGAPADEDIPVPPDLQAVIDQIVAEFRTHQRWAEEETLRQLGAFQTHMLDYVQRATRAELRQFTSAFRVSWNAIVNALFTKCNERSDEILQRYESWYTQSTQAVFDDLYRRDVLSFVRSRRFWEVFVLLGAIAGALTVVIGWGGGRRWVSIAVLAVALGISVAVHWEGARRRRRVRGTAEALSVVPFEIPEDERFPTEHVMRRGRRTTAAFGVAGVFLGSAAASGLAVPALAGVVGTAVGTAFDRFVNPTGRMRERMAADLLRFMEIARPQVVRYVLEAHQELLSDVRSQIIESYQQRVRSTVKLLTAGK
jgi:hypothetical protein